jgi:hypothetical protein
VECCLAIRITYYEGFTLHIAKQIAESAAFPHGLWYYILPIKLFHHVPEVPDVPDVPSGDKIVWHLPINIRGISRRGIRITFLNKILTDIF